MVRSRVAGAPVPTAAHPITSATLRAVADALDDLARTSVRVETFTVAGVPVRVRWHDDQRDGAWYEVLGIGDRQSPSGVRAEHPDGQARDATRRGTRAGEEAAEPDQANTDAGRRMAELERELGTTRNQLTTAQAQVHADGVTMQHRQRQIEELEAQLHQAELVSAEARRYASRLETEVNLLQAAIHDWKRAGETIAQLVFSQATTDALEYESYPPDQEQAWSHLTDVVKGIRDVIPIQPVREVDDAG